MSRPYFSSLMPLLADRSRMAAISQLGFASIPLRHRLRDIFGRPYGKAGAFLADPAFEAVFGWKAAKERMADLEGKLLTPELVSAMDQAGEFRFGRDWFPYSHQQRSWEILAQKDPQSLVVTSGTGSGKTECFMAPILDRLQRQRQQHGRLIGVRALFLYPLNALINNQRNRLHAWTAPFGSNIRFCLYNGNTPERPVPASRQGENPSEVLDRKTLRSAPPPILVTNATMLEYMLVRTRDAPILKHSQGKLEWIVLDEAHTYIGSQAAEIALLLRRVLHAFDVSPRDVRFVATSATIGDPKGEAGENLRKFLAELAGIEMGRVHLVAGERQIPSLPECEIDAPLPLNELERIEPDKEASPKRYKALCSHPTAKAIRALFTHPDGKAPVARLSEVHARLQGGSPKPFDKHHQAEALRWLDLLSGTRSQDASGRPTEAFLPLRAHLFHQTLSGIWACADKACPQKKDTALDDEAWPFGAVYLDPRKHCDCGAPVYEIANCGDCGTVYLLAGESGGYLLHLQPPHALDEFELDVDDPVEEEEASPEEEPRPRGRQNRVLIANRRLPSVGPLDIEKKSRQLTESGEHTLCILAQKDDGSGATCPSCGAQESPRKWLFRHGRLSAPFLLGNILPTLLEYAPDADDKPPDHPYRGRRLLSFTDSRQGTARLAARLQQDAERNRVRGLVYHLCLQHGSTGDREAKEKLSGEIGTLKTALKAAPNAALKRMITEKQDQLEKMDQIQPVAFHDLARHLSRQGRDIRFMRENYRRHAPDIFASDTGDFELAKMFLVREFGRRPKRANNLETMGLVAIHYPKLDGVSRVPQELTGDFDPKTWRDFLKVCLDFFVRSGGSLDFPREWKNWLGMRFGQTWLVPHDQNDIGRGMRRWPSVRRGRHSSLLVRLLAYVLKADLDSATGADRVDRALRLAWEALCAKGLLKQDADGRRLPLKEIAFVPMSKGFVCPVTRRILDTALASVTPYLPKHADESTACSKAIDIPVYPAAFGGVSDEQQRIRLARQWLEETAELADLRDRGLWSVVNDRVIELAPFFRAAEHSAQQDAGRLQEYEEAFQNGDINLLSCSTTMEMGIDIGGISLVAMNNVPPHPSSYLQRAGRAGRRQEARSLAMTLCKSNPHDQFVFRESRWAFDTPLPAPNVSLDSPVIVQRHVQAMLLTHFLGNRLKDSDQDQLKFNCGAFFLDEQQPLSTAFASWCRGLTSRCPEKLTQGFMHLLRHTLYEQVGLEPLFGQAADEMTALAESWRVEWENLHQERQQIEKEAGAKSPAYRAVGFHMERLKGEYLLRELANRGFLPAYGFPSHITPFDNYTVERFKREKNTREKGREDNRSRFRDMPSRDLVAALREYAPGSDVVLDGLVYRSAGLTLNWHTPASQEDVREVQNIKHAWRCKGCGDSGTVHQRQAATPCPSCGEDVPPDSIQEFIEPAGFAVDFYQTPTNDVDHQSFVPVEAPWIALDTAWIALPNPELGRFRVTTKGHIFHQSRGINGEGYALCLECGRAEPMTTEGRLPEKFEKPHRKLRRSKDEAPFCPGSEDAWKIKQGIALGHETWTDACEFQLKTTEGVWLDDEVAANTLAVALRDALAERIGVQNTELACATRPVKTEEDDRCRSILIIDRNAAGYASSVQWHLGGLFRDASKHLDCPANCDSVCPHCVLDFDQRFAGESMDRHRALKLLTKQWLDGFRLPEQYAFFGQASQPVFIPLVEAIWQAVNEEGVTELRLHAGDDPSQWDVGVSPLRKLAYQIASRGVEVTIVMPSGPLDKLDEADRHLLAGLAEAPSITVATTESALRRGSGWLLAEALGRRRAWRWATDSEQSQAFGGEWGEPGAMLVSACEDAPKPEPVTVLDPSQIRPAPLVKGDREIDITHQLDGKLKCFGRRFWKHLAEAHEPTCQLLESTDVVTSIAYQDRYLFSPLSVRILYELIRALQERLGESRWSVQQLRLTTMECRPDTRQNRPSPRFLWHDWRDNAHRDAVIQTLFQSLDIAPEIQLKPRRQAPHGRLLECAFASGKRLRVRLDQGVSFWRAPRSFNDKARVFDFNAAADRQAKALRQADVPLVGEATGTQLFVSVIG